MSTNLLIIGNGYIGKRIQESLGFPLCDKKLYTLQDAEKEIARFKPRVIVNSVGYIGRNVDDCEVNKDKTLFANTFIPILLAEAALRHGIKLVHISSGCIFHYDYDKDRPLDEKRTPDFFELYYSRTKIYAEQAIAALAERYGVLILRIRVPLDDRPHPKNILTKLIKYKTVIDLPNSVTYIPDFIKALRHLVRTDARGIYHVVNKGGLRYPELLDVYRQRVPSFSYTKVPFKKLGMVRTNVVLSTAKLERSGFPVRTIQEVLEECVNGYLASS